MSSVQQKKSRGKRAARALLVSALMTIGATIGTTPAAQAATIWVTDGVMHSGGSGSCDAFQARGDFTRYAARDNCAVGGALTIAGSGYFPSGDNAFWITTAPPGITINSAWTQNGDVNGAGSAGFVLGDFWKDNSTGRYGGSQLPLGRQWFNTGLEGTPNINSSFYGMQIVCGSSSCSGSAVLQISGIELAGTENQGPSLSALGGNNLWYQASRWVHNDNGDGGFPIALAASDPSGVCNMWAVVNIQHQIQGPTAVPNTTVWHQCPDQTWTQGAVVNTRDYIPTAGPLSLELDAVNAAGVTSRVAETLWVDNDPVGISLTTPNDPDTAQWVGHSVTVDAAASAGPSGVGGVVCNHDGKPNQGYTAAGVTVDGDGIHTVTCTAWNQARGPNGSPETGTRSIAVRIDEAPPTAIFEPQNPADPTGLVVDTSDSESGVAGGQIQMRPAAGGPWTPLPTQFDGHHLLAHFNDAGLNGPYDFQAVACDAVGNCSASDENLALPLRLGSSSAVSFHKIVNPAQPRLVRQRVRVGWHWAKKRRHGHVVRVKRGGHFKTIKVWKVVLHCTSKRVKIARHRWRIHRTCTLPKLHLKRVQRVRFGHKVTIHGLLQTAQGIPLAGVPVRILTAPNNGFDQFTQAAVVTTDGVGGWSATLPSGPSRKIEAIYDGAPTILPAGATARIVVTAKVKLTSITPNRLPWGQTVRISGRVLGGYIPAGSKLLRLDIGVVGLSKIQGIPNIALDGRFSINYTFNPGSGVVRFWFQVSTLREAGYPFSPGRSRRMNVTVGVPTPAAVAHHHRRHRGRQHRNAHRHRDRRKR
jgi:hypothetical protein